MLLLGLITQLESAPPPDEPPPPPPAPPPASRRGRASGCRARHNTAPPPPGPPPPPRLPLHARPLLHVLGTCILCACLLASLDHRAQQDRVQDLQDRVRDAPDWTRRRLLGGDSENSVDGRTPPPRPPPRLPTPAPPPGDNNATERAQQAQPMVPHEESMEALWSVVAVISLAVVVLGALGVVSCLVGHQRPVPGGMGGEPPHSTLPMLALHSGMERLRLEAGVGAGRPERQSSHAHAQAHAHARRAVDCAVDRAVRLAAVSTDLQLDLPPSIALPDGEEYPPGASARLHIRDPEQESEIYQKCVRPPPNKTVYDGESPPPYRPSSAGSGNLPRYPLGYPHHPPPHPHGQPHGHPHGGYAHGHPHGHGPVGPPAPAAGHGLPAVIVPPPPRTAPTPALFLAGPTGKHSTHPGPSGAAGPSPAGPAPAPSPSSAASSAAAGLARLLSPARERPERGVTVDSRTAAHGAQSAAELVNSVSSDACDPTVRDIPGAARSRSSGGSGHLAAVPMVPCLTESTSRTEPRGPPEGPGRPLPRPDRHRPA